MVTENSTDSIEPAAINEPRMLGTLLRDDTIKIEVGPGRTQYSVHPGLLAQHSVYFKRALYGPWKEAEERVIKLDDVDCQTFEIFLTWLYTGYYPKEELFDNKADPDTQLSRLKVCEFGDRFQATEFMHISESAFFDSLMAFSGCSWYATIIYAFNRLPSSSPVLQALIDKHGYQEGTDFDTKDNGELELRSEVPSEFWIGISLYYMRLQQGSRSIKKRKMDRCDYHRHESGEKRGRKCKIPRIDEFDDTDDGDDVSISSVDSDLEDLLYPRG